MNWYNTDLKEVLSQTASSDKGLTESQVVQKREEFGPNEPTVSYHTGTLQ